jgi:hypothetical protein
MSLMALQESGYRFRSEVKDLTSLQVAFVNLTLLKKLEMVTGVLGGKKGSSRPMPMSAPVQGGDVKRVTMTAQEYVAMRKKQRGMI